MADLSNQSLELVEDKDSSKVFPFCEVGNGK